MSRKNLFTTVSAALIAAIFFITSSAGAANLNQALAQLPQNEEWSIMAYASLGQSAGSSYLSQPLNSSTATDYEKRILAITSQGLNPRTISSENFVSKLESMADGTQLGDRDLLNDDIFGILALKSAGGNSDIISKSRQYLLSNQNSDGGWGYGVNISSDSNTTGAAVAALAASGSVPSSAVNFLKSTQGSGGGYGYTANQAPDGASTAWVMWGLRAAGESIPSSATTFLDNLQLSHGQFKWRPSDTNGSTLVTAYAVIALSGKTLPVSGGSYQTPYATPYPTPNVDTNNSTCVGISAPDSVRAGATFNASISFRNSGTKTWSQAAGYKLGSQSPQDNSRWGTGRVDLTQTVSAGATTILSFTPTAPASAGTYSFNWRMLQENVEWFGATCEKTITVTTDSYPTPYTTPYSTPYATPYTTPYPTPYSTPYTTPYSTPYATPYSTPYATPYPTPYPTPHSQNITVSISYPNNKIFSGDIPFSPGTKALDAMVSAANKINLLYQIQETAIGRFVRSINGYGTVGTSGWQYSVNGVVPTQSAADFTLSPGDVLKWFYGAPNTQPY